MQEWHARVENSTRARFYMHISNFKHQIHLDSFQIDKYRKWLCKFRVSSHRLEIEAGCWTKPKKTPLDNRKCIICNVLEDEYHFVLECSLYLNLRTQYINKYSWKRPSMVKFKELVSTENVHVLKKLSIYTGKAFKLRQNVLYS